jgi:hypothetical protein
LLEHSNALRVIHDVEPVEVRDILKEVNPLRLERVDLLEELGTAHHCFIVDAIHLDSVLVVFHEEVDTSKLVHKHAHRHWLDILANLKLFEALSCFLVLVLVFFFFFIIILFFVIITGIIIVIVFFFLLFLLPVFLGCSEPKRESDWALLCRRNAIKHNAIIVLVAEGHVGTSANGIDLEDKGLLHEVISRTFHHASFVLGGEQSEFYLLDKKFNFKQVEQNVAILAILLFLASIPCARQKRDKRCRFLEGGCILLFLLTGVSKANFSSIVVNRETKELLFIWQRKRVVFVWSHNRLDVHSVAATVRSDNRVNDLDFLAPDFCTVLLGGFVDFFLSLEIAVFPFGAVHAVGAQEVVDL